MPKRSRNGLVINPKRCRRDQRERRQVDPDRPRPRPFADDQVELEILHRGIEDFFDRRRQPMDLVDEQHIAGCEVGEQCGKIAGRLNDRPRGGAEADPELARDICASVVLPRPGGPTNST